jgi:CheY-like chemotaxis protein
VFLDIRMHVMAEIAAADSPRHEDAGGRPPRIIGLSGESQERESHAVTGMDDFLLNLSASPTPSTP